jgi:uncharacterized protein (TIGR02996 family)
MLSARESLEAALDRSPGDLALHMAYADCLIESGDPRGEYIRLCLAAEEPGLGGKARRQRMEEADRYLQQHQAEWLGPLADFLLPPDESRRRIGSRPRVLLEWKRGWIVGITCYGLRRDLVDALTACPYCPFLESLAIDANNYPRSETDPGAPNIYEFFSRWPFSPLRKLIIQDRQLGDDGTLHVVLFPCFFKLKSLTLTDCGITDDGASMLSSHPHAPKLESLRLDQNLISPMGLDFFAEQGIRVSGWQRFGGLEDAES